MHDELLLVPDVAQILKTSKNTVYDLMNNGLLPYLKLGNRKVSRTTIDDFIAKYNGYDLTDFTNPVRIVAKFDGEEKV